MSKQYTVHGTFDTFKSDDTKLSPSKIERLREEAAQEWRRQRILDAQDEEREFVRIQEDLGISSPEPGLIQGEAILVIEDEPEGGEFSGTGDGE